MAKSSPRHARAQLDPYLGLHYPARDIPPQARRLYLRQRVGAVANSSYQPVPLLSIRRWTTAVPLDLTHSALRSVSPMHREYMRNMGTAASLTIGLAARAGSVGHAGVPSHRAADCRAGLRAVAEMIGQVVSLLLASLGDAETYAERLERNASCARWSPARRAGAAARGAGRGRGGAARARGRGGAVVRLSGKLFCLGRTPPLAAAEHALAALRSAAGGEVLAVNDLGQRHPDLAACTADGSGALLLPLAQDSDDAILWFRPELSQTVAWGGDPPTTPRWSRRPGASRPAPRSPPGTRWFHGHVGALDGGGHGACPRGPSAIEAEVVYRIKAELARLRDYDPLTGLPNRSLLEDWLGEAGREAGAACRPAVPRPRPLQGGQRHDGPRRGGRAADRGGAAPASAAGDRATGRRGSAATNSSCCAAVWSRDATAAWVNGFRRRSKRHSRSPDGPATSRPASGSRSLSNRRARPGPGRGHGDVCRQAVRRQPGRGVRGLPV